MNETSEVALKLLAAADEHQLKQFRREIAMLRSLSEHDGVVQVRAPAAVTAGSIYNLEHAALLCLDHDMVLAMQRMWTDTAASCPHRRFNTVLLDGPMAVGL